MNNVLRWCFVFLASVLVPLSASGQDYFGKFETELTGAFKVVDGKTLFVTSAPFQFVDANNFDWPVPAEQGTDGASIPPIFWPFIGHPMEGNYLWAAVVHDYYWRVRTRDSATTHRAFYNGMRAKGVEPWKADLMYWAVLTFGDSWNIQKQVTPEQVCTQAADGTVTCDTVTTVREVAVAQPGADLTDPDVLAVAEAKMAAVARTLKTSEGAVLDVSPFGQVLSGPEQIEQSALAYRQIFSTESFREDPSQLGLLTEWGAANADTLAVWPGNDLPTIQESPDWGEFFDTRGQVVVLPEDQLNQGGYTLRPGDLERLRDDYLTNLELRPQFQQQLELTMR